MKLHKAALTIQRKHAKGPIKNQFDEGVKLLDVLQFFGVLLITPGGKRVFKWQEAGINNTLPAIYF